jgi:hypothetical protein
MNSSEVFPRYSVPFSRIPSLAASLFFGGRRSFREDGLACMEQLTPPLHVLGKENIPHSGPCLITFNHYYRPGFHAWWMALAMAASVPTDIHFGMTAELTFPGKWYAPAGMAGSRWLLRRFSKIYGFTAMPPMPPRPQDVKARAHAVRKMLAYARKHPRAVLALAPEGGDQPGGIVSWPPAGAGRFIALLAGSDTSIVPVGTFEDSGLFCLSFGEPYPLRPRSGLSAAEQDSAVAGIIMRAIARQLPPRLRGEFNQSPRA